MYFKQIDALRFFSVFLVLISHWLFTVPYIEKLRPGAIGVELFFVISGFLISLQLFKYKLNVDSKTATLKETFKNFYARRFLRIVPLYYFVLIIATAINKGEMLDAIWWNLSYCTNFYFNKTQQWPAIFSQLWSLSVEEHFYIFWPFIVLISPLKHILKWIIGIIMLALVFRVWQFNYSYDFILLYIHSISCLDLFMMGAILAYMYNFKKNSFIKLFNCEYLKRFSTVLFFILVSIYVFKPQWELFNWAILRTFFCLFYFLIVGFFVSGFKGNVGLFLENKLLIRLGKLSYCIYLIHNFVPGILLPIKTIGLPIVVEFLIYFIVTVMLSEILYRIIEKPARELNKYFEIKTT